MTFGTLDENLAEAAKRGLTGAQMLRNLDARASRLGERLVEIIATTPNDDYHEQQLDRLAGEAKELRRLRSALLSQLMAGDLSYEHPVAV